MTKRRIAAFILLLAGWSTVPALVPKDGRPPADDDFSPLFARRLDTSVENMDTPSGEVRLAGLPLYYSDPVGTPLSANPLSACALSACGLSGCLLSGCGLSGCLISGCGSSACIQSGCGGSACLGSLCGASGCLGSACGGSACLGSACSTCLASEDPDAGTE